MPEAEYQRCCSPNHITAASTTTDDGRRMSINVEKIGASLMIQHYIGEVAEKHYCKMISTSDLFTPNGRTRIQVIWELSMKAIDAQHCEYTNTVTSHPTQEFLDFIQEQGMTFEEAARARQPISSDHNRRETPLFVESIARAARANR
ncbi:hypothetical protein KSD_15950 [Ktedonobacter sp. SOSP1-85]|nr:hypothetical protein [Ktedonobacter sp. SOSP1-85]GHO73824.1 hypothetical protein KSD_15950 [Ktedonobacter sp. SOSP1-85]